MYRGASGINIDAKGRVAVPTRFRASLEDLGVVLTIDTEEKCLLLYPTAIWEEIESKLVSLPAFDPASRRIQRLLMGHATELELDSNGRILLPTLLREYAGLEKRLVLVGQGKKFEIWDETHWQERRRTWLEEAAASEAVLSGELMQLPL